MVVGSSATPPGSPSSPSERTEGRGGRRSGSHVHICANIDRGGHTYELLQILDDDGQLVGFVGVETSLLGQHTGGSIVTHFTALPHAP